MTSPDVRMGRKALFEASPQEYRHEVSEIFRHLSQKHNPRQTRQKLLQLNHTSVDSESSTFESTGSQSSPRKDLSAPHKTEKNMMISFL